MCVSESVSDCYVYLKIKIQVDMLVCRAPIFITFGVPGTGIFRSMAHMFSDVFRSVGFTLENWGNPLGRLRHHFNCQARARQRYLDGPWS